MTLVTRDAQAGGLAKAFLWLFAAAMVLGAGFLSDMSVVGEAAASFAANPMAAGTSGGPDFLAAGGNASSVCNASTPDNNYLPALRWSPSQLPLWPGTTLGFLPDISMNVMNSLAAVLFSIATFLWRILFVFLNLGVTFHPICSLAPTINDVVADMGTLAAWFAIPIMLIWLVRNMRKLMRAQIGRAIGSLILMMAMVGGIFYVTDRSKSVYESDSATVLQTVGTVPWAADTAMGAFATAYTSISSISNVFSGSSSATSFGSAFYDTNHDWNQNDFSCNNFTNGLYEVYESNQTDLTRSKPQIGIMTQMSRIWERTLVSSWLRAAFGPGSATGNYYPAQAGCRLLEMHTDGTLKQKAQVFANAHSDVGMSADEVVNSGLAYMMGGTFSGSQFDQQVVMAWAGCQYVGGEWTLSPGAALAEKPEGFPCSETSLFDNLRKTAVDILNFPANLLFNFENMETPEGLPMSNTDFDGTGKLGLWLSDKSTVLFLEKRKSDVLEYIGAPQHLDASSLSDAEERTAAEQQGYFSDFAMSAIGEPFKRAVEGFWALIVAIVFAWAFIPAAVGLIIVGIALVVLLLILPITLLLIAVGQESGLRLLKLTGGATAVMFVFGLLLSTLSLILGMTNSLVTSLVGANNNSFFAQAMLAVAPVAAVLILRKLLQIMGMGNITSLSGSLGLASAVAAKTAGSDVGASVGAAASKAPGALRRGAGTAMSLLRGEEGDGSGLQRLAEGRMGESRLGRLAASAIGKTAKKAGEAGAVAKDTLQSRAEERAALAGKDGKGGQRRGAARLSSLRDSVQNLAKGRTGRYGAVAAGIGAAGVAGPGLAAVAPLAATVAAAGGLHAVWNKAKGPLADRRERARLRRLKTSGAVKELDDGTLAATTLRSVRGDDGQMHVLDDEGNLLRNSRQLAYARRRGLTARADLANRRLAERSLRNMPEGDYPLYTDNFDREQLAGLPTTSEHSKTSRQMAEVRRYVNRISDPEERNEAVQAITSQMLDSTRARQNGALDPSGLNPAFTGYSNEIARQIGLQTLSVKLGVDPEQLVLGTHGLAVPAATLGEVRMPNGAPALGDQASLEMASHPALYLDRATLARSENESDEFYSARITASLAARGLLDDQGQAVDVFALNDIDVKSPSGARRVQAWLDGGQDETLSAITFNRGPQEGAFVRAAEEWASRNGNDFAAKQWKAAEEMLQTRHMALSDTVNIGSIPVALAAPSRISVREGPMPDVEVAVGTLRGTPQQSQPTTQSVRLEAPAPPQEVTLEQTYQNLQRRTTSLSETLQPFRSGSVDMSSEKLNAAMKSAAEQLQQTQHLEREVSHTLEGLRAATHARAHLAVEQQILSSPEYATHSQVQLASKQAMSHAQEVSGQRRQTVARLLTELSRATRTAQHATSQEDRMEGFRKSADAVQDLQDAISKLYDEESEEAAKAHKAASDVYDALERTMRSSRSSRSEGAPTTSAETLAAQAELRQEAMAEAAAEE